MSLFGKDTEAPEVTATAVMRDAMRSHNRSPHMLSLLADQSGVPIHMLEHFVAGGELNVAALEKLAPALYPGAKFNSELNRLQSTRPPATVACTAKPPSFDPDAESPWYPKWDYSAPRGWSQTSPKPPPAASGKVSRGPGWVE
jgi:hypothetical protein